MVAGILGFKDNTTSGSKVVYTVPTGKIAVVNIFANGSDNITINEPVGMGNAETGISVTPAGELNTQLKGIVLQAGACVRFGGNITGIVTGFEEDA